MTKLPKTLSVKQADWVASQDIHLWRRRYEIKNERNELIDFRKHYYLYKIYDDFSPKQVILKAAQIGFSTLAILKTIWLAAHRNMDIIYTLPAGPDVSSFVSGKVNRMVAGNQILRNYVKDKDSVEQKQVRNNFIYYRATWTERAALMVSADLNVHDEYDRSKQDIVAQYRSRLQHSKYGWEWYFSNPSTIGNGVSRYWEVSDQKHWFVSCKSCNYRQYLSFPDSIDFDKEVYQCKKCGKELSDEDRRVGEWVFKYANREFSGYWISLLMAPWISAKEIIHLYHTKSKEYFYNFVLGLPFVSEGISITPDLFYRNCTLKENSKKDVVIGCDSGLVKHYVIGNKEGIFQYGSTEDWKDIEELIRRYDAICVIDALPDLTEPRRIRDKFKGKVFLCHFARDRKTMQLIRWGEGDEHGNVLADRNRMIQSVVDAFANREIPLYGTADDWAKYYTHWADMYRTEQKDVLGSEVISWECTNETDHFALATTYWKIGMDKYAHRGAGVVGKAIEVPSGPTIKDGKIGLDLKQRSKFVFEQAKTNDWRNFYKK